MSDKRYLSTADTAKLLRKALRRSFPGQQFFVRSHTYSLGASIDVDWIDGPAERQVRDVTDAFAGAGFDAMIDLKFHYAHWLLPDGSIQVAGTYGTEGSGGTVPAFEVDRPHPDAELVSLGADYVHTHRAFSRERVEGLAAAFHERTGIPIPEIYEFEWYVGGACKGMQAGFSSRFGHDGAAYNQELWATSFYQPPQPAAPESAADVRYQVTYDREWTWIAFEAKPAEAVRDALKCLGGRFSRRRLAWYIQRRVDRKVIHAAVTGNADRSQPTGEDWFLDAHL